ncbi:MAG TPA: PilZ domain-containing protein [Thermoanaerobaculia bacterium]|nr:PilZ domain-containing protein [Thermoanaerobaculia bacterium]
MTTSTFIGEALPSLGEGWAGSRPSLFPPPLKPRLQRIALAEQLVGEADGKKAIVIDLSLSGALIAQQFRAEVGSRIRLQFDWRGETVIADCEVMRAQLHAAPVRPEARAIYRSGVAFHRFIGESERVLRGMVDELVTRALDERKANAKGIPPIMASSVQTGRKGRGYLTLVFEQGVWRRCETVHPEQPDGDGFTVSIDEDPEQIEMLCEAWENAEPSHRRMIREMARISISNQDGIPARRYEP